MLKIKIKHKEQYKEIFYRRSIENKRLFTELTFGQCRFSREYKSMKEIEIKSEKKETCQLLDSSLFG